MPSLRKLLGDSEGKEDKDNKKGVIYARVSSSHQKEAGDLKRQIEDLQESYPEYNVIKDVGSGLNFKRPGLQALLEQVYSGTVSEVVVRHKDRLCRYGLEILEFIFKKAGTKLVVLSNEQETSTKELADDLLAITTVFVARHNGQRSAENRRKRKADGCQKGESVPNKPAETGTQ